MTPLSNYLKFLNEQSMGVAPNRPVQRPQSGRKPNIKKSTTPQKPKTPLPPQVIKQKQVPKKNLNPIQNREQEKATNQTNPKAYFNYMVWTSKILKQGEIFRKNCYSQNCSEFEIGTGDRRICKDRCDIETCKKVIALLRASMSKCSQAQDPNKCKQRYAQLIPLYQDKLNKISRKFIEAEKRKKKSEVHVG